MGFEFLVVIGTVFMLPFVAAGFVAFCAMNDRERTSLEGTWELYAARRVRELVPARGEWPNRSLPCVRWRKDGVRFELSVVGREAMARTRLVGQARGDRGPGCEALSREVRDVFCEELDAIPIGELVIARRVGRMAGHTRKLFHREAKRPVVAPVR